VQVDLNADLGESTRPESVRADDSVLTFVSSANLAAGMHAGTPRSIREACRKTVHRGLRVGALVGYRDLLGGGDRYIDVDYSDLSAELIYQVGAVEALAFSERGRLSYVRPHGALARMAGRRRDHGEAILAAVSSYDGGLPLVVQHDSPLLAMAHDAGLRVIVEYPATSVDRMRTSVGLIAADGHPEGSVSLHLDPVTAPVVVKTLRELGHTAGVPTAARRSI